MKYEEAQSATQNAMRARLAEKAQVDDDFRSRLLSMPKEAIKQELDISIPDWVDVQVHEESAEVAHLVLPPHPKLDETQLSHIAGGRQSVMYWCM